MTDKLSSEDKQAAVEVAKKSEPATKPVTKPATKPVRRVSTNRQKRVISVPDDNEIMVPMAILGATLFLSTGFFAAMREWIQVRVRGGHGSNLETSPPQSRGGGQPQPPGASPTKPGYGGGTIA